MEITQEQLNNGYDKPPIGLMPKWFWDELYPTPTEEDIYYRKLAIKNAIDRYNNVGIDIPEQWVIEQQSYLTDND